jgi:hypothetical protein
MSVCRGKLDEVITLGDDRWIHNPIPLYIENIKEIIHNQIEFSFTSKGIDMSLYSKQVINNSEKSLRVCCSFSYYS